MKEKEEEKSRSTISRVTPDGKEGAGIAWETSSQRPE